MLQFHCNNYTTMYVAYAYCTQSLELNKQCMLYIVSSKSPGGCCFAWSTKVGSSVTTQLQLQEATALPIVHSCRKPLPCLLYTVAENHSLTDSVRQVSLLEQPASHRLHVRLGHHGCVGLWLWLRNPPTSFSILDSSCGH